MTALAYRLGYNTAEYYIGILDRGSEVADPEAFARKIVDTFNL